MVIQLLGLIVLLGLNAFFASAEIALLSLNESKVKQKAEQGDKKAQALKNLLRDPNKFLSTIQIGITLAGFLASAFASDMFAGKLADLLSRISLGIPMTWLNNISVVIITLILSYFSLVLGELVPKRLAMKRSDAIARFCVGPINALSTVTAPFVKFLSASTNFVVRLLGIDPNEDERAITEEEILLMLDEGEEKGTIDESEREMITNIFEFDNKIVTDIMTHRTDVVAISIDESLEGIVELVKEEKYTRFPVYEGSIDNIVGILHAKELIKHIDVKNYNKVDFELSRMIRPAYYVPSSKKIAELFREMQKNKVHMAVVIDEYGGTEGIVTIEDLMEEIVGNIFDEYDEEEKDFEKIDENTYIFNGTINIDEVQDFFNVKLPVDDYDTLSGFVIGQLGRIPGEDDKPEIEFNGLVFKVEEVDEKRVAKVKICRAE
ncbi:MAG: hemolysin family protein [Clostridia bacterium]|nr:HlyC/CorC family transporter [Clostridia bacterium]